MAYSNKFKTAIETAMGDKTLRPVAQEAGISPSYLGNITLGYVPSRSIIVRLAAALRVDPDGLLSAAGYASDVDEDEIEAAVKDYRGTTDLSSLAQRFREAVAIRAASYRDIERATGGEVSHMTARMLGNGLPVRLEAVETVARFLGEDVNEWRVLAGHPPISAEAPADQARRILAEGLADLGRRYETATWESQGGTDDLTPEKAQQILQWVEEQLAEVADLKRRGLLDP